MYSRTFAGIAGIVGVALAGFLAYGLYRDIAHNDCGLSEADARARVLKELARREWPAAGLGPPVAAGTCHYEYDDRSGDRHFGFTVLSTWNHGIKIGWYDHSQDALQQPRRFTHGFTRITPQFL